MRACPMRNARLPDLTLRRHFRHVRDLPEAPFQRLGQARRDDFRAGPGQLRLHADRWKINLRQGRHRQFEIPEYSGQRDGDGQ